MSSEDSDTVLIDHSGDSIHQVASKEDLDKPPALSRSSTSGVKRCWICIGDSTEDNPDNPPVWRSPCTCNLTAHESCLLDWVADLENPRNKRKPSEKILCPQCKSEIKISRPRNYIVDATRVFDRAIGQLVLPTLGLGLATTLWSGAWIHGFQSVLVVFGQRDASYIFEEATQHRAWLPMYALVPVNLIFSRTSYADFVLPTGTLFLLATQMSDGFEIDMTIWPPLPSTVFACLPALRNGYNWAYNKAFAELNKKWLEEIQPRNIEIPEGQEDNVADLANRQEAEVGEGGIVLEVELNIGGNDDNDEEEVEIQNGGLVNADGNANGNLEGDGNNDGNGNGAEQQNGHVHQILGERGDQIVETSSGVVQTALGALAFPTVAAGMGELLAYVLPSSWMSDANWMNGRPGLLRNKWGRSVVGGCLFVVLKDALLLYCRWKLAQNHRSRRIMNYDKQTKKYWI